MLQILLNGLISGLVIALLGLAFTVASLPTRVFHVALSGVYTAAPFILWSVWKADWHLGWGIFVALAVGTVLSTQSGAFRINILDIIHHNLPTRILDSNTYP